LIVQKNLCTSPMKRDFPKWPIWVDDMRIFITNGQESWLLSFIWKSSFETAVFTASGMNFSAHTKEIRKLFISNVPDLKSIKWYFPKCFDISSMKFQWSLIFQNDPYEWMTWEIWSPMVKYFDWWAYHWNSALKQPLE
jgi:hypothetical protein